MDGIDAEGGRGGGDDDDDDDDDSEMIISCLSFVRIEPELAGLRDE